MISQDPANRPSPPSLVYAAVLIYPHAHIQASATSMCSDRRLLQCSFKVFCLGENAGQCGMFWDWNVPRYTYLFCQKTRLTN